jgi:hypothetical protein
MRSRVKDFLVVRLARREEEGRRPGVLGVVWRLTNSFLRSA